jgi:hypothetical protein
MASEVSSPPRFFVLKKLREGQHDTEFSRIGDHVGPALRCPQCKEAVGSLTWQPPFQGELELYGRDFGDLMHGPGGGLLVTERFAEAFKTEGLTGLSGFQPVEILRVRRKRRSPPPRYLFVMPAYGQTALDMERSSLRLSKPFECSWCRDTGVDAIAGLTLEEGTWSGEDVFRPRGLWGIILVSERFVRFAAKHALSHIAWVPIDKYVWDPLGVFHPEQLPPTSSG